MKRVEFQLPAGFVAPEGAGEGEEWDQLCRLRRKGKNGACLIAVGEAKMPGYEKGESPRDVGREAGEKTAGLYKEQMGGGY